MRALKEVDSDSTASNTQIPPNATNNENTINVQRSNVLGENDPVTETSLLSLDATASSSSIKGQSISLSAYMERYNSFCYQNLKNPLQIEKNAFCHSSDIRNAAEVSKEMSLLDEETILANSHTPFTFLQETERFFANLEKEDSISVLQNKLYSCKFWIKKLIGDYHYLQECLLELHEQNDSLISTMQEQEKQLECTQIYKKSLRAKHEEEKGSIMKHYEVVAQEKYALKQQLRELQQKLDGRKEEVTKEAVSAESAKSLELAKVCSERDRLIGENFHLNIELKKALKEFEEVRETCMHTHVPKIAHLSEQNELLEAEKTDMQQQLINCKMRMAETAFDALVSEYSSLTEKELPKISTSITPRSHPVATHSSFGIEAENAMLEETKNVSLRSSSGVVDTVHALFRHLPARISKPPGSNEADASALYSSSRTLPLAGNLASLNSRFLLERKRRSNVKRKDSPLNHPSSMNIPVHSSGFHFSSDEESAQQRPAETQSEDNFSIYNKEELDDFGSSASSPTSSPIELFPSPINRHHVTSAESNDAGICTSDAIKNNTQQNIVKSGSLPRKA